MNAEMHSNRLKSIHKASFVTMQPNPASTIPSIYDANVVCLGILFGLAIYMYITATGNSRDTTDP